MHPTFEEKRPEVGNIFEGFQWEFKLLVRRLGTSGFWLNVILTVRVRLLAVSIQGYVIGGAEEDVLWIST